MAVFVVNVWVVTLVVCTRRITKSVLSVSAALQLTSAWLLWLPLPVQGLGCSCTSENIVPPTLCLLRYRKLEMYSFPGRNVSVCKNREYAEPPTSLVIGLYGMLYKHSTLQYKWCACESIQHFCMCLSMYVFCCIFYIILLVFSCRTNTVRYPTAR